MTRFRVVAGRPYTPRSDELPYGPGSEDYEYDGWRQEQDYPGPERRRDEMLSLARTWDIFGFVALLFFLFVVFSLS